MPARLARHHADPCLGGHFTHLPRGASSPETLPRAVALALTAVMLITLAAAPAVAQQQSAWPAEVPDFQPVEPGEHPRLFFRQADLPEIRRRAATSQGQQVVQRLRFLLNGSDGQSLPEDLAQYTLFHGAGYGMLYQLTGEQQYADLGRKAVELALEGQRDRDERYSFRKPGGALRAGPSLGAIAMAYDLCYEGWDEQFRTTVAGEIANYNEGRFESLEELVRGARHMPASNHWGMQVAGGALAVLAIKGDPGVDAAKIDKLLEESSRAMIRNLTEGFGDHGWFAEGDGTGVMASMINFLPALQAWRTAGGKDFITPRSNAPWLTLRWIMLTIPRDSQPDFPSRGAYPQNVWSRTGMSGPGIFCQGFACIPQQYQPALLWLYNRVSREQDLQQDAPWETASEYPHRPVFALINWPDQLEEDDPARVLPKAAYDSMGAYAMFRNRWQDENDILITHQGVSTRGWHRANTDGRIWVWAHGNKTHFPVRIGGKADEFIPSEHGGLVRIGNHWLAVDFSGASGAEGLIVMTGPISGNVSGENVQRLQVGQAPVVLMVLAEAEAAQTKVEDGALVIGQQTIRLEDGRPVFASWGDQ